VTEFHHAERDAYTGRLMYATTTKNASPARNRADDFKSIAVREGPAPSEKSEYRSE
jgi:hypothetical protein